MLPEVGGLGRFGAAELGFAQGPGEAAKHFALVAGVRFYFELRDFVGLPVEFAHRDAHDSAELDVKAAVGK